MKLLPSPSAYRSQALQKVMQARDYAWKKYPKLLSRIDEWGRKVSGDWDATDEREDKNLARDHIRMGKWTILIVFGFFGAWAAFAPIHSAAIARGTVVVDTNRKTIQHLEGGIIDKIFVKEGDEVKSGQELVHMDETNAKTRYDLLLGQHRTALASEARLVAERDAATEVTFPEVLLNNAEDPAIKPILDVQRKLFEARKAALEGQVDVLGQKIAQSNEQIKGLEAEIKANNNQLALLYEEISVVKKLLETGNAMKPRLLSLQRQAAELEGRNGDYNARIAGAQQAIAEAQMQIINQKNEYLNNAVKELKETQLELSDLDEKMRAGEDMLKRTTIVSPIDGKVIGMKIHTIGGVVQPGEKLMDIVPENDKRIVEAQIMPNDIDVVHVGLQARVKLSAYRTRWVPTLEGKVIYVSADKFTDERNPNISYFIARIELDAKQIERIQEKHKEIELYPGMPTDVLIVTGSRSFLNYYLDPLFNSVDHSFREQ